MSFQSDIGNESYLFFEKLRCMSLLMPFGTVNEAEKMINFASMIITPKKQFTIEKARVEFLVGNDTSKYTDALSDNRQDHWESGATVLFASIFLGLLYSKKDSYIEYSYRLDKHLIFVLTENRIMSLDGGKINLDYARFEAFLKYLKSLPLPNVKEFKFRGIAGQLVRKEDVFASYPKLMEKESNRTGGHPFVIDMIDKFLGLGNGEKSSIVQIMLNAVVDVFINDDVEITELDKNLHTDAFFLNSQWLFSRLLKKDCRYHYNDMLFYINDNCNSIKIGDKKLSSYFPAKFEFDINSSVFLKLVNTFINETIQFKMIEFNTETKELKVKLFMDKLFVYNKSLFFGLQVFVLYLKEKFFNLYDKLEIFITIRNKKENLDNIYEAVKGWVTVLRNTGEGSRLVVIRQPMEEDDGLLQGKLADIDLSKPMEETGQVYPLDNQKLVTVQKEVVVDGKEDEPLSYMYDGKILKPYPVLSYDHFFVEAMDELLRDYRINDYLHYQFAVALPALREIAPKIKHKKIPLLDYVAGVSYQIDNLPTLILLNFLGNYTVPVREMKFMDGMIHHIFRFNNLKYFGKFAGLMLLAYAYNCIMDTHIKVSLDFHFSEDDIEFSKPYINDWVSWFLSIEEVDHIEIYIGDSLLHICDRNK